jgi:hypothetical protein
MRDNSNQLQPFAEVVESSLHYFVAQCWDWDVFPSFGSIVQIEEEDFFILGCVSNVQTGSMDPMRYPFPYQKTEKELKQKHPHIFEFLKTTFTVITLGYITKNDHKSCYVLPSKPGKIHSFVQNASIDVQKNFLKSAQFLHVLFANASQTSNIDELFLSVIMRMREQNILKDSNIYGYCKTFSLITGNDYKRLKIFLQRLQLL